MPRSLDIARHELPTRLQGRHVGEIDPATRDTVSHDLLVAAAACDDAATRQVYLDQVVLLNGSVAESIARRYRARGIDSDDLIQVAYLGLVKAAQGYRPGEGAGFLAYAVPTISGEVKRHFRDFGWVVRPPRRLQELCSKVSAARADLSHRHGREATPREIAEWLGVPAGDLAEADLADGAYAPLSLDSPARPGATALADMLVDEECPYDEVDTIESLRPALKRLSERDLQVLRLRFVRGWTQEQIGEQIGVSQMQVSRILTRILADLRHSLRDDLAEAS